MEEIMEKKREEMKNVIRKGKEMIDERRLKNE